ncbi:MAG: pitrilysin family protein [Candidatus Omnitrophota bacterium]|nr:pitrilysin family protein [Candidatus Omnitrophota bacterium]
MHRKTKLDNGLRVVTNRMPGMRSVAIGIWIKVGGRYENEKNKGISHYLEHLLFKGSKKYSCRKLKEAIEGVGGSLNGFTSEELTCYLAKLPHQYLNLGLDVLADMALNPLLPEAEVEKERTVILEELKMYKDQPQSHVYDLLDELLWPKQILGMNIIGSFETIGAIKRGDLQAYKLRHYTPLNIVVSVAGLLEEEPLVKKIKEIFVHSGKENINSFMPAVVSQARPQLKVFDKATEQTHLALGFHSLEREHPLKYAQGLLHVILGANMSSRLFEKVREKKGLAYEIGTQVKRFQDTGAFLVHAGIDNRKVLKAVELILAELDKIKKNPVSADELKRAKDFYLGQTELALEDTLDHMLWIGESMSLSDKIYTLEEITKGIRAVTREDIRELARQIFKEEGLNLALIGPLKNSEQEIFRRLRLN